MNTALPIESIRPKRASVPASYLWKTIFQPRSSIPVIASAASITTALVVITVYALVEGSLFFIGYLSKVYPPPPAELSVWIQAWGEFPMLPFLKIPAESYRLFAAIVMLPLALGAWMLMAGSARIVSILFNGKASYEQWLNLTCFCVYPFLILSFLFDVTYSGVFGGIITPALQMQYGPIVKAFFLYFPQVFYPALSALGGVYTAYAARQVEGFAWWKSGLIGLLVFAWPTLLWAVLLR